MHTLVLVLMSLVFVSTLIKLTRQELYSEVRATSEVALIRDKVGNNLAKDAIAALLHKLIRETKEVVNIDKA